MELPHDDSKLGSRDKRGDWKPFTKPPLYPIYLFPLKPLKGLEYHWCHMRIARWRP